MTKSNENPIEGLTAAECRAALEKVAGRRREVSERLAATRPPKRAPAEALSYPGAPEWDPMTGAGPEYRRAMLEGTPAELRAVLDERAELDAEALQLDHRRHALQGRLKAAEHEEAVKAAPKRAAKLLDALPGVLDRLDEALEACAAALDERARVLGELDEARELAGGEPYYPPELLRRVWASDPRGRYSAHQLRGNVSTRPDELDALAPNAGGGVTVRADLLRDALHRLEPVREESGLFEKLRRKFASSEGQLADHRARQELERRAQDHARHRVQELAAPKAS